MSWFEAFILGVLQGLTEFLPVSSSGHLELGKIVMGVKEANITFTVVVHGATVLSTMIIFWKQIVEIFNDLLKFSWNSGTKYTFFIILSMIPAVLAGLFLEDRIDAMFSGNLLLVGSMLIFTSMLLGFTYYAKPRKKRINSKNALVIGIAQALAIIPGISRSGSTIATGLLIGNDKAKIAQFSFLMVIPLIIAANAKKILDGGLSGNDVEIMPLIVGFITAFVVGLAACKWMINIVKKGKLIWFAAYCMIVGLISIVVSFS